MTTRRDLLSAAALLAPMAFALKSAQAAEEQHQEGSETGKTADFLFVQNAKAITYADGRSTL